MNQRDEHERVIELLRRARRPEEEITPERLEENLRWLMHLTLPPAKAPEGLRQRVRERIEARRGRPPSLLDRLFHAIPRAGGRALAGAVTLAVTSVVLLLLFATRAPAQVLARTLAAMAQVRSAHCTGWHVTYRSIGTKGQRVSTRLSVEWWYKRPDSYRKETEPTRPGERLAPVLMVIKANQRMFGIRSGVTPVRRLIVPPTLFTRYLSPLDFFSPQGFLHRAEAEQATQVIERESLYHNQPIQIVEVEAPEAQAGGRCRKRWILYVDPASDRIIRSESRLDCWERGAWQTKDEEILDDFAYDIPVKDSLFDIDSSTQPLRPESP
jgi:hypothetical protein